MKNINRAMLTPWYELKSIWQADVKVLMVIFFLSCLLAFIFHRALDARAGGRRFDMKRYEYYLSMR